MVTHKTGGEVDAFCTKCQLTLAHTILAMVGTKIARVRCNTCNGDHAMRSAPGAARSATPRAPKASAHTPKSERVVISFEQRLSEKDTGAARTYSPRERFAVDELVRHPTFGIGIVTAVRVDKIDIDFKAAQKTLVHGRDAAASTQPTFARPSARPTGPSDKPMAEVIDAAAQEPAPTPTASEE